MSCEFSKRRKAVIIDFIIASVIFFCFLAIYISVKTPNITKGTENTIIRLLLLASYFILPLFKDFVFKNGSIGNKIMKIKIIDDVTKENPKKRQLFVRSVFFILEQLLLWRFFYETFDMRSIGDIVAKTRVVDKNWEK